MKNIFKTEMKRGFLNRSFLISIGIGLAIAIAHVIMSVIPSLKQLDNYLYGKGEDPYSIFNKWIGGEIYSIHGPLFRTLLPIIAAIPYADSLFTDKKNGYCKNLFVRVDKVKYYISKYVAVFLTAGAAVVIPLIFNFYLTSLFMPAITPSASSMSYSIFDNCMWSNIFYTNPYLYVFLYLILVFIFSGIIATSALAMSYFVNNRFAVLISPFVLYIVGNFILSYIDLNKYSPKNFLSISQGIPASLNVIIVEGICLFLLFGIIYYVGGRKDELN